LARGSFHLHYSFQVNKNTKGGTLQEVSHMFGYRVALFTCIAVVRYF
jgi:hypothetical protein